MNWKVAAIAVGIAGVVLGLGYLGWRKVQRLVKAKPVKVVKSAAEATQHIEKELKKGADVVAVAVIGDDSD